MKSASSVRIVGWSLFVVILVTLALTLPSYWVYLLTTVGISALIARSVGVVTLQTGLITLCQMAFAAIGGWIVSWLSLHGAGTPFPLLVLAAGLITLLVGLVMGLATIRIRGIEFAVVTLGFAAALDLVLRRGTFPGVGSSQPVALTPPFDDGRWFFVFCWTVVLIAQLVLTLIERSRMGLAWNALRTNERSAAALGVKSGMSKATAFAIGASLAGTAGGLLAGQYGFLTADVFSPITSMMHLVAAVLCGASLFAGSVLAGILGVFLPELLRRVGLPLDLSQALLALGAFDVLRREQGGIAEQVHVRLENRQYRNHQVDSVFDPLPDWTPTVRALDQHPVMKITQLTVDFGGVRALDAVDLELASSEVQALIGPNGAGKSTLVDAITGFLPQVRGSVVLDARDVSGWSAPRRAQNGLRRTFQHPSLVETLTVGEYLKLASGANSESWAKAAAYFSLPEANIPIRLMNVASRRLLEIAGALAGSPKVLLLDEPAAGMDTEESTWLAQRVRRIPEFFGCSVLLIEHDMAFVRAAADSVTALDEGSIISHGPTKQVLNDAAVVTSFLGVEGRAK